MMTTDTPDRRRDALKAQQDFERRMGVEERYLTTAESLIEDEANVGRPSAAAVRSAVENLQDHHRMEMRSAKDKADALEREVKQLRAESSDAQAQAEVA